MHVCTCINLVLTSLVDVNGQYALAPHSSTLSYTQATTVKRAVYNIPLMSALFLCQPSIPLSELLSMQRVAAPPPVVDW